MTTIAEQIASVEATREAKSTRMNDVMQKSLDENRSTNTAESEEFDTLQEEIKSLDADLVRLRTMERIQASKAQPVQPTANLSSEAPARQELGGNVALKSTEKLEPGIAMARYAMCLLKAKGDHTLAFKLAEKYYPQTEAVVRTLKAQSEGANLDELFKMKAVVPAGTTTDATWAAPLVDAENFGGDFINYLRPRTLIGQADFRRVPFNVRVGGQTSGGSANWVGQGKAKPVTSFAFNATTVPFTKVAAIAVITQELARFSDPAAEGIVRESLADAVIERIDTDLFDPDKVAVSGVSPAGLLNGVAPVQGPTGSDPEDIWCAIMRLWAPWDSTNLGARPAYYTTPAIARALAFKRDALGQSAFPGMTAAGGSLNGIPVRTSQYLANNGGSGGSPFILVDESEIWLADDGSVTVDASDQASLEMSDTPTGSSSPTVAATSLVSMWQTNSFAFRAERFIWWGPRRSGAIAWIDGFPAFC